MGHGRNTVNLFFLIVGGALLVGVVYFAPWPVWAMLVLAILVAAAVLGSRAFRDRSRTAPPEPPPPYIPVAPVQRREQRVDRVALPSSVDDYDFLFSATVFWASTRAVMDESIVNPAALAIEAILERAKRITQHRPPGRASLVQHELSGALGRMQLDAAGHLQAMAESIVLVLPEHDQERLDKLAAVRKDKALWEHERKYEQSKREYLGEDVLKNTGSAVVWWLTRNDDHVEKTVQDIGLLAQLSAAANNKEIPERFHTLTEEPLLSQPSFDSAFSSGFRTGTTPADCFEAFLRSMDFNEDDPQRSLFTAQVAEHVMQHGRQEVAAELLRRFDASPPPMSDPMTDDLSS
ncbi:hypothetical protein ACFLIM_48450 [Nonomuraea sp. M3C6]|uniref:Secreted protein n=1 Tax=Nonomuraea marmarensis TaxID=3351344 RepID=A0ABW7AUC5_9ACTN